jgi:hypothetical protein
MSMSYLRVTAVTADALATDKFRTIPPGGAIVNVFGSSVTKSDAFGFSTTDKEIVVGGSFFNIESSADVIDTDRDQLVFNEPVRGGSELFLPVSAVSTEAQFLVVITPLQPRG